MRRAVHYDLSVFHPAMSWDERIALILRTFPSGPLMDDDEPESSWGRAFDRDPELMGRVLRDILKAAQTSPTGRPGPRPALDAAKAQPVVDSWLGRDPCAAPYTTLSFGDAFTLLAGQRSLRHVEHMTGLPRTTVSRLMRGQHTPSSEMIVKVAQAFNKQPSYFVEWRIGVIASAIVSNLTTMPERSVRAYESLFWHDGELQPQAV